MTSKSFHAALVLSLTALTIPCAGELSAQESTRSFPPDLTPYTRPAVPDDTDPMGEGAILPAPTSGFLPPPSVFDIRVVDAVVSNSDPNLTNTDTFNDGETSIAVNPRNPREIVVTTFAERWGTNAPLWHSRNGGKTWTKRFTINAPPGVPAAGCPCDQTVDYGRGNRLSGTFLVGDGNIYSSTTRNPQTPAFMWFEDPPGTAQRTNNNVPSSFGTSDQPWLIVNRAPKAHGGVEFVAEGSRRTLQENVYVGYDDFNATFTAGDLRVAVAAGTNSPDFAIDNLTGSFGAGGINPGHRLAGDARTGAVYSLFQNSPGPGAGGSKNIDYMLNRSTDGGQTWTLSGSATGIVVANADSTQPTPKFCTVNALLGGVLHAAVDRKSGDVFYVYGNRDPNTGNNRLAIRRISDDGTGGVIVGPEVFLTGQVQAAIPSVAIADDGTVGVFYYTCDGFSPTGFPVFTAHFSLSRDLGETFTDLGLLTFLSSATDNGDPRQRVLGDYMQTKSLHDTFYGAFTGNGLAFGRPFANHDPIFFRASVNRK